MFNFLRKKYDWFIYFAFSKAMKRIYEDIPGMAYLVELRLRRMREEDPLPESLMKSTEIFEYAMSEEKQ